MAIINLDADVLRALNFFAKNKSPIFKPSRFKWPFVVGSEGAFYTGKMLFENQAAILTNESTFKKVLQNHQSFIKKGLIKEAVVISASGEKDAIWEIKLAQKYGLKTTLLTCNPSSTGARIANKAIIFGKISEPYTYNFSTYFGMLISASGEKPVQIRKFLQGLKIRKKLENYNAYAFVIPDNFAPLSNLITTKGDELFGSRVSLRAFTFGQARHAKFVVRWEKELVLALGEKNYFFGHPSHRWDINLPAQAKNGTLMALTYYLIGKIQASKPPYFKKNIAAYCKSYGPQAYGRKDSFPIIVPGS